MPSQKDEVEEIKSDIKLPEKKKTSQKSTASTQKEFAKPTPKKTTKAKAGAVSETKTAVKESAADMTNIMAMLPKIDNQPAAGTCTIF